MIQLYNYFRSSASFRVRIALNLKGIQYQDLPVHLTQHGGEQYSEQYQKINPQCLVPTLTDHEKIISQSLAIIEYLDECYREPPLLPQDPYQKALVRSFTYAIACEIHPLNNLRVLNYLLNEIHITEEQKIQWYHHWLKTGFEALEKKVQTTAGQFCFGDQITLADIVLVPQMYNARRFSCDVNDYPTLVKIDDHCRKLAAFAKAAPAEVHTA